MAETKKPLVFRDRDTKKKIPFYVKTEDVKLPDGTDIGTKVAELEEAIGNAGDGTVKSVTLNGTTIEPDANGDVELTLPEVEVDDELDEESGNAVSNAAVTTAIEALRTAIETVIGEDATQAIENFQEVLDFLADVHDDESLIGLLTALQTAIDGKISGIKTSDNTPLAPDSNGIVTLPPAGSTIFPATAAPSMDGNTALVGSSAKYAREDHVHPHDSTKANVSDVYSKTDADALLAGKQNTLAFDDAPGNTDNPVKSRGIKQAIDEKLSQVTVNAIPAGSVAVEDNLASTSQTNALSANMGAELYALIQILFQQLNMVEVSENGLYFIDSNGNIGVCIDSDGLHAINILEHVITG